MHQRLHQSAIMPPYKWAPWPLQGHHGLHQGFKTSWASPMSTKASRPSLGSSASSVGSSTSSAKWWLQDPALWVQGPCQLGTRCFKAQTHSLRDQGTAGGTWWHQWHPMGPLQVHVGINDNFINKRNKILWSLFFLLFWQWNCKKCLD